MQSIIHPEGYSDSEYVWDFFIAYASGDKQSAQKLYSYLHSRSRVFLDSRSLLLGDDWDKKIATAQQQSRISIVLISSNSENAYYQREEIATAIALAREDPDGHRVVPVFLDQKVIDNRSAPYGLRTKQGIVISSEFSLESLANELLELLNSMADSDNQQYEEKLIVTPQLVTEKYSDDITLNVSVITDYPIRGYHEDMQLQYNVKQSNNIIRMDRSMGYLTDCQEEGVIKGGLSDPFQWDFPNLDLKIVNNSAQTIFLTEVVFNVQESRLDPSPVLTIKDSVYDNLFHFLVVNEGWGEVRNLKIRFCLKPNETINKTPIFEKTYPYEVSVGNFTERFNVDISDAFRNEGVDIDWLRSAYDAGDRLWEWMWITPHEEYVRKGIQCLGPFREGLAIVSGELEFDGIGLDRMFKTHVVNFITRVYLVSAEFAGGGPFPPTAQYEAKFQTEGSGYERRIPISHVLKSQDVDRFNIKLWIEKSSSHRFNLALFYNNELRVESPEILLTTFIPRSGIALLSGDWSSYWI